LQAVERMREARMPVRGYVRQVEADALLALRSPQEARAIYAELVAADAANRNALIGRFYAEVECEDFSAAFRTADEVGDPVLSALARNYAGLDAQAWRRIGPVLGEPPVSAYARSAAGSIEAARGWTRRAHDDFLLASSAAPDDIGVSAGLAESFLRRRDLPNARAIHQRLSTDFPGNLRVERLARDLRDFDSASFDVVARARQSSGDAPAAPGPGIEVTGRVHSAPIDDNLRLFAGVGYAKARPPEGDAIRQRAGVGGEWRGADATIEASAWANGGDVSRAGMAGAASWSPNDLWALTADYETCSWETPLRATLHGITADGGGVGIGWAAHESRSAWLGLRAHRFSDGNERRQFRLAWAERVAQTPSWSLTLRPELYGSENTLRDAPYFNPSRDMALSVAVDWQGLLWRRYEASWRHRVIARVGRYRQDGFADGMVGGFAYEQSWQPGTRLELRWGVEIGRARYDGADENVAIAFISVSGRF
jgi:biofilm PGA synthesis protein PgaA